MTMADVYLYQVIEGEYSDRSETWYSHPEKFTQLEFHQLLHTTWQQVKPMLERQWVERERDCRTWFGVSANKLHNFCANGPVLSDWTRQRFTEETGLDSDADWKLFQKYYEKHKDCWLNYDQVVFKVAGFTEVEPCAHINLTPPWKLMADFERELEHEANRVEGWTPPK